MYSSRNFPFSGFSQAHKYWQLCKPIYSICMFFFITARKRSLQMLCFYTCLSVILFTRGGGASIPACIAVFCPQGGVVSPHALQVSRSTSRGQVEGSGLVGGVSRLTPRGQVEGSGLGGGSLQAHTRGVSRPTPGGFSRPTPGGGVSRPTPRGWGEWISQHALRQASPEQMATAVDGTYPTGIHSCFKI